MSKREYIEPGDHSLYKNCPHNALRRCKDERRYPFDAYICGNCAKVFEVTEYVAPPACSCTRSRMYGDADRKCGAG